MTPLAEILRPKSLDDYIGQQHLIGQGAVLRTLIESGNNAAQEEEGAILFIDEIHRFNKAQQDSLLGAVERGTITLIGATTENPSFEVISALLSRCQVYVLKEFGEEDMRQLIASAVKYYATQGITVEVKEDEALMRISGGDARKLLNAIELVVRRGVPPCTPDKLSAGVHRSTPLPIILDNSSVTTVIQQNLAFYDKGGEMHYDIISAFIKSMRGSDPNGAVYWLARMIAGGESKIGYPECRINLSQCACYLACSAKSNATYMALNNAEMAIKRTGDLPVPLHIRNAPTKLMKNMGYGDGYKYAHDFEGNFTHQEYLPQGLEGSRFYEPGNTPRENETRRSLHEHWGQKYGY